MFFPPARYVASIDRMGAISLAELCAITGVECKATGSWVNRSVAVVVSAGGVPPGIEAEPGSCGAVRVTTPAGLSELQAARYSLAAMAYGLFDLVARQSVRGAPWVRPGLPKGRRPRGTAKSNMQRQREFQARKRQELK